MSYPTRKLKDIASIRTGKLDSNAAVENGAYPFFTCDPQTLRIDKWAYDTEAVLLAGNNASGNYTAKYFCGRFNAYQRTYIIEENGEGKLFMPYLYFFMDRYVEDFIYQSNSSVNIESPELSFKDRLIYARDQVVSTFKKVFPYILIGVGIGAVIHNWIPESVVEKILGNGNPLGVILATVIGIPMYADIFGTIPIAEALLSKGALLGVVLSFMMAVTTLSLPSLIMLRKAVKPKLLGMFIVICTVGIIIVGYFFNFIQPYII